MLFEGLGLDKWAVFMLVLLRASTLMVTMPFLSSNNISALVKAGFSLSLAVLLTPMVNLSPDLLPRDIPGLGILALQEVMIGGILGLSVRLLLTSVQIMGQLAGFQMGFAVANVIDPMSGGQVSILAQFVYLMTLLVLLLVGGHYFFFKALADSFTLVPPGSFGFSQSLVDQVMNLAASMFSLAIKLGAPVIGALLFTQVTLGVLAKTVPQMNILMVGFPLTVSVGIIFMSLTLIGLIPIMVNIFKNFGPMFIGLLKAM
jgi:flagellar biosynthetic protein FliR